ncbi:hypothetical protein [uncultured Pseudacidovorax sp.]|uniref:gp53-like domain-containing protein n=1 Tax=uncultured Pseudacidovorax sp. TaxID=679313 RepID=UPI0025FE203D|nr:hypothetical protein [uncultured Pseudacidovorax sp.]
MKRIDTLTAVPDLFGSGKPGFRDGDLAAALAATNLNALFCNGLQEEIIRVIEAAGLTPSGTNLAQLLAALSLPGVFATPGNSDNSTRAATTAFVRNTSPASLAAGGWQKLPSGLLFQWGTTGGVGNGSISTVTFPIAFPTACAAVVASPVAGVANTNAYSVGVGNFTAADFKLSNNSGTSGNVAASYIALGY